MKKVLRRISILFAVFVLGVIGFSMLMNEEITETTREMGEATLPVMCIDYNGYKINQMFGYKQEIQQDTLRDGIVPLTTDREITVSYQAYGNEIDSITYEVTNLIDGTVIENAKIGNFRADGTYMTASFTLQQPILMNQEYGLKFTIHMAGEDVNYYTRIVQRASLNTDEYIAFAYNFYEKCMNREAASELNSYLETPEIVTNSSYTNIDIHSSFNQITWGSLQPVIYRKAVATVKEINDNTGSVVMEYMISARDEEGNEEYYYVTDFFRMRYFQSRIMLIDFERDTQQIFDEQGTTLSTKGIELGIASKDLEYEINSSSNIAAFVQAGELWSYNTSIDKLVKVFSMRSPEAEDVRDAYHENDIKIIRVEEGGDVDFAVYGYMNRDEHEGQVGISIWHYSAEKNMAEELVFIPNARSFEYLQQDIGKLSYVNREGHLFVYLENTVYKVSLYEKAYEIILEDINPDCFFASDSQSQIAWMHEMEPYASSAVTVMNLEEETTREIKADEGQKIQAVGFMNHDFIYGYASDGDIVTDAAGSTIFGISKLMIDDIHGENIKTYANDGVWISNITIEEGLIELERVVKTEFGYVPTTTDNIMNNKQDNVDTVTIRAANESRRGTILTLIFSDPISNRSPLIVTSRVLETEISNEMALHHETGERVPMYYVYAKGGLVGIYSSPAKAILEADSQVGVVLNDDQQYVWERGNSQTENEMNNEDIPEVFLNSPMDEHALQEAFGDTADVLNLSGCTLEEVLYQLSADRAVMARKPDGSAVVIVGYDRYNTLWYDYATGEHTYYGLNDSTNLFLSAGNVFLSYIEKPQVR